MSAPRTVRRSSAALLHPTGQTLQARLCWSPADPLAVSVSFRTAAGWVDWVMARELLAAGLVMPAGAGDVRLAPVAGELELVLDNGRQRATLGLPTDEVAGFLALTYRQIPLGAESIDLDPALALLLSGGLR